MSNVQDEIDGLARFDPHLDFILHVRHPHAPARTGTRPQGSSSTHVALGFEARSTFRHSLEVDDITRAQLIARGMTDRSIRRAMTRGELERLRPGHYCDVAAGVLVKSAVAGGGRLACLSELRERGLWVLDTGELHLHVAPTASRLRRSAARVHWKRLAVPTACTAGHVGVVDALIQAHGCLGRFAWMASVDSALRRRAIRGGELAVIRRSIRATDRRLVDLADGRADSGIETIVRMIAVALGFRVRVQVRFAGVGRVDVLIEDWIVVETDGNEFHDRELSPRDRRRDAQLVILGRTVLRPGYSLVVYDRTAVARQLIEAVANHRRVKHAGRLAARARYRLARLDLS